MRKITIMKKADIHDFFARLQERDPEPKGELDYTNPYTLVVAVALSAQATDIGVNKATKELFKIISTPQEIIDWCHAEMAAYKCPRVIEFTPELPKSGSGKVLWRELQSRENANV